MSDEELSTGGYVYESPYRLMRLRMLLTGTNTPVEAAWSDALGNLLQFLDSSDEAKAFVADIRQRVVPLKPTGEVVIDEDGDIFG